jgi:hypothetical protein
VSTVGCSSPKSDFNYPAADKSDAAAEGLQRLRCLFEWRYENAILTCSSDRGTASIVNASNPSIYQ